jgi:hypothetical protein
MYQYVPTSTVITTIAVAVAVTAAAAADADAAADATTFPTAATGADEHEAASLPRPHLTRP